MLNLCKTILDVAGTEPRHGVRRGGPWHHHVLVLTAMAGLVWVVSTSLDDLVQWAHARYAIIVFGLGFAAWRWGWAAVHLLRAVIYRYWAYARIRRRAALAVQATGPVPDLALLMTTYRERAWITERVVSSVVQELANVHGLQRPPLVVAVTGGDEDDAVVRRAFDRGCRDHEPTDAACWPPELRLIQNEQGKRTAIADALRVICDWRLDDDGVAVFMDGDTAMNPGLLVNALPIFRLPERIAAVTTNEDALVDGPGWFREWITMRFGQRHLSMCSMALSKRLTCLTGRLSIFRGEVATDPTFRMRIADDRIDHWLWGSYQMLSGDDKSSWYWLASRGLPLLYVPDAMATTIEVVEGTGLRRAYENIRRWSGNMLRANWRAMSIGPRQLGLFLWWCLIDQRIVIFTLALGPIVALLGVAAGRPEIAAGYLLWVILSRTAKSIPAMWHGRRLSAFYTPLLIVTEWVSTAVKMWLLFHPTKQNWFNRGAKSLDSARSTSLRWLKQSVAVYLFGLTVGLISLLVAVWVGAMPLIQHAPLYMGGW